VALGSALAQGVSTAVLPAATRLTFPAVHSIFFADALGLPWEKGLTWNPEALAAVSSAIN
jgi:triacylglycerol lipase